MAGKKYWDCARDNLRGQKSLGPLKMSLEMAHKVIVQQKEIMSRSFLNSGTLIVIMYIYFKSNSLQSA
jgi:hypothetical protein